MTPDAVFLVCVMSVVMLVLTIIMGMVMRKLPARTRPSIFFSVTVPPSYRETAEAREVVAKFQRNVALHTVIAALLIPLTAVSTLWVHAIVSLALLLLAPMAWQMVGMIVALVEARRVVRPHAVRPTRVREAILRPAGAYESGNWVGGLLLVLPVVIVVLGALYLSARWEDIPEQFPIHWNAAGEVDNWGIKTPISVFSPLFIGLLAYLPCVFFAYLLPRARRVSASGAGGEKERRFRRFWRLVILAAGNLSVGLIAIMAVWLPFRGSEDLPVGMVSTVLAVTLGGSVVLILVALRQGQGGQRWSLPDEVAPEEVEGNPIGDGTPDDAWIAGLLYFNRNDPAVMVERRFGIGWDFNWGNVYAWLFILMLVLMTGVSVGAALLVGQRDKQNQTELAAVLEGAGYTFVDNPRLIGTWKVVDFVERIQDFDPRAPRFRGDLFLKELTFEPDGRVQDSPWVWTKGAIIQSQEENAPPAKYEIQSHEGSDYLFMEWISGDVTNRGMQPAYYVLRKQESDPSSAADDGQR